ncbi:MAG: tetratricopeptide repeat protein [Pirellulaceae bacterium]
MRMPLDPPNHPPHQNALHPNGPFVGQRPSGQRPPLFNWWMGVLILVGMFATAVVPALYYMLPREIDRWHRALVVERRLEGDLEGAVRSLSRVIDGSPDNDELLRQRAEWRLELRDLDAALDDVTRAIELNPENNEGYLLRSQIYQRLDRHDEALADWETLAEQNGGFGARGRPSILNGRAYARAIAGKELDAALEDVQQAIEMAPEDAALLDTRGYIQLLRGEVDNALKDMDRAVELAERNHKLWTEALRAGRAGVLDLRELKRTVDKHAETVAVIRYHRALVYDELGESSKAEKDRSRVRELGFEPNEDLF